MNENKINENNAAPADDTAESTAVQQDYQNSFMPNVHRIGHITMIIAFFVSFLPAAFFFFFKGEQMPISSYANTIVAIASIGIGMWLTEPLVYWPVLGSAGTYIAYLSGNVGAMRFPVALSIQSTMKADINTPRGQVITIIGIVASVFTNLVILLTIVLIGSWLLSLLQASAFGKGVVASFGFVMPCLIGVMLMLRFASGKAGVIKNFLGCLPYLVTAIACKLIITYVLKDIAAYGTAIAVGMTVLVAYILYRIRIAKTA